MLRRVIGVTRACVRCLSTDGQRKRPLPAIARLDPARTLPVLVRQSNDAPREGARKRAGGLAVLEANLQGGQPDQVWQAYSDLVQAAHRRHGRHVLTPWDYTRVLRVMNSHGKRERQHVDRVLSVLVAVRSRQRQTVIAFQKATAAQDPVQLRYLKRRLQEWDEVISPAILNSTIGLVGLSLRKAKLEQVDDALSQLLEAETDRDSTRRKPVKLMTGPASMADEENVLGRTIVSALAHLRPRGPFPDLTTYNTLLEIVTRMFHRRTRAAILKQSGPDEDVDRFVEMQNELNDARADEQYAAMTEKMRALDLDVEVGPITLELADKLFHAILHRMRHKSHLEPDAFTYNIMVSMYCQLGQTDEMHRVIRTLQNKGLLTIETINNVMWKWVTWLPTSAAERLSAIDDVVEMYGILRDNLVRREMGAAYAAKGPAKEVVKRMLGIDTLTLVPDKVTYVSLIQVMARSGRFSDALGVFKDLVSTPKAASSEPFQADFPVFDSFFRGFSRYGRPSQLVHYNQQHPEQSEWTTAESGDNSDNPQLAMWNMDTFREIFDAFLQFRPDDSAIRAAGRSSLPPIELTSESLVSFGDDRNNKRRYSSPYGTLALKDAVHLEQLRRAPSTNQLFWILVALRRVSGDNARWTLAMWEKVDAKFANTSHTDDVFTWTNYSHDHRLNRVLRLLRDSIDGDEISRRLSALV